MSSNEQQRPQTYWCHECDMSIHLLITTAITNAPPCPHCHTQNLELMDDPTLISTAATTTTTTTTDTTSFFLDTFFLPFFNKISSPPDDSKSPAFDTILPTVKVTASLLEDPISVCAVCKDNFVVDVDDAKVLPCNHLFHPDCILPWLNSNHTSCPLCRVHLLPTPSSSVDDDRDDDSVDSTFPDVGTLSNFLPSHF